MRISDVLERFELEAPVAVMARTALAHAVESRRLDEIFAANAVQQKCGELAFSTVVDLMALVALKAKPSVNAAYMHRTKEKVGVAIASIYNKLQGIEPAVGRAMVRETAKDFLKVIGSIAGGLVEPVLKGYRTRIIDGNHLAGTEHRIQELRTLGAAALPGQAIPILDPDSRVILDLIPCEDGHAGECRMVPDILALVQSGELWIGDRKFGTKTMMLTIALDKKAHFLFRHSLGNVPSWKACGAEKEVGKIGDDTLYEQSVEIEFRGRQTTLRRIAIKLAKPTRKGDSEIYLFTNLPSTVKARKVAELYRHRWKIETAFQQLAVCLKGEIKTLGYPKAALFSFCTALMMFNLLSVIKTAIAAAKKDKELVDELSTYYLALEISETWSGLRIALTDEEFSKLEGQRTPSQLARRLISIGKNVNLARMRKSHRGPKKPPPNASQAIAATTSRHTQSSPKDTILASLKGLALRPIRLTGQGAVFQTSNFKLQTSNFKRALS